MEYQPDIPHRLKGHTKSIVGLAVCPDGTTAVSGSHDGTVGVWDLATGKRIHTLEGYSHALAVTSDGTTTVIGYLDGTVGVWDLATGKRIHTLEGHTKAVQALAVTPDGTRAVSRSADRTMKDWDLATGELVQTLETRASRAFAVLGLRGIGKALAVTPDGTRALSGSADRRVRVWDLTAGELLHTLEGHTKGIHALAVTPDGTRAVSGSRDTTVRVWDLATGERIHTLETHAKGTHTLTVTPGGTGLICITSPLTNPPTMQTWDLDTGKQLQPRVTSSIKGAFFATTPDGSRLVAAFGKELQVWNLVDSPRPDAQAGVGRCGRCATSLLTEEEMRGRHPGEGLTMEVGNMFEILEGHHSRVDKIQSDRNRVGITCVDCGAHYCTKCMTVHSKPHPTSGGRACLSCRGRMRAYEPLQSG